MAKYASIFVATVGDTDLPTPTSFSVQLDIRIRNEGNIAGPLSTLVYFDAMDTVNEANRKIIEGAQAYILSQLGLTIPTRNIFLFAGAV